MKLAAAERRQRSVAELVWLNALCAVNAPDNLGFGVFWGLGFWFFLCGFFFLGWLVCFVCVVVSGWGRCLCSLKKTAETKSHPRG